MGEPINNYKGTAVCEESVIVMYFVIFIVSNNDMLCLNCGHFNQNQQLLYNQNKSILWSHIWLHVVLLVPDIWSEYYI